MFEIGGSFAGTFAGIVFIWRLAILVDSLDTLSELVIPPVGIERPRAAGCVNRLQVAKLTVEFGLAVPQHCTVQKTRIRSSRERDLPRQSTGDRARARFCAAVVSEEPIGVP